MERVDYESVVIQDLEGMYKREELDLAPWYQRRSVWTPAQKAYLINSLFESAPIPTCYIRHYLDVETEKSMKEVVDGQQRIRAILDYLAGDFAAPQEAGGKRVRFDQLSPAQRSQFRMKKVSVGYLINADDADVIDIFGRLNSVAKTLNEQEKRNAKFSGAMKQFCLKQAATYVDFWRSAKLFTATEISRMTEVQFASDLIYNLVNGLSDFSPTQMDRFYAENDEDFAGMTAVKKRFDAVMTKVGEVGELIANTVFNRSPIFFSLFVLLDTKTVSTKNLKRLLSDVDAIYLDIDEDNLEDATAADVAFYNACISTTQRIKSRQVRHDYLVSKLA